MLTRIFQLIVLPLIFAFIFGFAANLFYSLANPKSQDKTAPNQQPDRKPAASEST
ncbi:MAG: hypothetical protein QNJ54_22470 [Prochloraceae cyanobacterium]|nr:hypothetical protein [Prochloraceae cyanobacterium]